MGHVFEPLLNFIRAEAPTTDVFCFQELVKSPQSKRDFSADGQRLNLVADIQASLPDFEYYFAPMQNNFATNPADDGESQFGVGIFYRKSLKVDKVGSIFIYKDFNTFDGKNWATVGHNAVYLTVTRNNAPLTFVSVHGTSQPANKLDTPERLEQSEKILNLLAPLAGEKIIMGDFNLEPNTQSVKLFEEAGYKNLIKDFKITNTRGTHMRTLFPEYANGPYGFQEFADYAFVTPGIQVKTFSVPDLPISDHLPLILEF
jgi:endonuclease/exonuclease/phosphatase family metal-dependent hydrolase